MATRFWMLQLLGWLPFVLLQALGSADDRPASDVANLVSAVALTGLAIAGSLVLRDRYRRAHARGIGELRWLGLALAASIGVALVVDAGYYAGLWALSGLSDSARSLREAQPLFARAPLVALMYVSWSVLYLALSRQQRLQQAAVAANALQLALKEAQIQRLLGQLSPHFTFNALNNIRALILKDTEAARDLLARFAATLRYQFADADIALVTVEEEMAVVRDYLELLRLQLGSRLRYEERIDDRALPMRVPRFALQLLVENAIKHGLGKSPGPGLLAIDIRMDADALQLEVRNTGVLGDRASSAGIGLANLEERLRLGFGATATLSLAQQGEQVLARIRMGSTP